MKYVIFEKTDAALPLAVLVNAPTSHADVARLFALDGWRPVSAGFVNRDGATFGRSTSLDLGPRPSDALTLRTLGGVTVRMAQQADALEAVEQRHGGQS